MADPQQLSLILLSQRYRGEMVRQYNRNSVLLRLMPKVPGSGQNVAWPVEGSGAYAESYSEGADVSTYGADSQAGALLSWGLYRTNFRVTDLARRAAASNPNPVGVQNLRERSMTNGAAELASQLNKDLYAGNASNKLVGLDVAIEDSNTYAGIDRTQSANAYFRSSVFDPGTPTALTFAQIRGDLGTIYEQSGFVPNVALCSVPVFNTVANLFTENRRYVYDVQTAKGTVTLDQGFGGLEIDGCIFIRDKDATASTIYYLNTEYMEAQYLPPDPMVVEALNTMAREYGIELPNVDDGFGQIPLGLTFEKLAKTGPVDKYMGLVYLQLALRRPNAFGRRVNVLTD